MTTISGPEDSVIYTLTAPDGSIAVFNDETSPDYVGFARWTGLDSPEVRESAYDLVQADGGVHNDFYLGRRPIVGSIEVLGSSTTDRNTKLTRLIAASNAFRGDAELKWTPTGGVEQFVFVRRQQPLRIEGNTLKSCSLPLVAADPRIYGTTLQSSNVEPAGTASGGLVFDMDFDLSFGDTPALASLLVSNAGTYETPPEIVITGPITNPVVTNVTAGKALNFTYTLGAGETLTIDTYNRTIILNGTTNRFSALDIADSDWWFLLPGTNNITLYADTYTTPGALLTLNWRNAWL